uniref:Uncharacterized protein n=1 Tax=Arundo donax TaxID=35708 RepID=A0A0A9GSW9_ARUDO
MMLVSFHESLTLLPKL